MSSQRDATLKALVARVAPALRERGFRGSLPHMQRIQGADVHLFSVQFSKWGDGFTIELGTARSEDLRDQGGHLLPVEKAKSYNAATRARLSAGRSTSRDRWFRYRAWFGLRRRSPERLAEDVLRLLPFADAWWEGSEPTRHIVPLTPY